MITIIRSDHRTEKMDIGFIRNSLFAYIAVIIVHSVAALKWRNVKHTNTRHNLRLSLYGS